MPSSPDATTVLPSGLKPTARSPPEAPVRARTRVQDWVDQSLTAFSGDVLALASKVPSGEKAIANTAAVCAVRVAIAAYADVFQTWTLLPRPAASFVPSGEK